MSVTLSPKEREMRAIVAAIAVTLSIFGLFVVGYQFAALTDTMHIAAVTIGLVVYCIVSGRLKEFSAGGISAKLTTASNARIESSSVSVKAGMPGMDNLLKGDLTELRAYLPKLTDTHPVVLSVKIGPGGHNNLTTLKGHLHALGRFRSFRFVLFVDQDNELKAYIPVSALTRLLQDEREGSTFIELLNQGEITKIASYPSVTTKAIRDDATNLAALETMVQDNLEAIVVVDSANKPVGVVEREQVTAILLVAVARDASTAGR
jgi:CBS domain-containing protein